MNRRDFLNLAASFGITAVLPFKAAELEEAAQELRFGQIDSVRFVESPSGMAQAQETAGSRAQAFNAMHEYGQVIEFFHAGRQLPQEIIAGGILVLMDDAQEALPKNTPYEILRHEPINFDTSHTMAWYYSPRMSSQHVRALGWHRDRGVFNHGRFVT